MHCPDTFDIAICGAGPAGMTLAALLARRGVAPQRIALIDAQTLAQAGADPRTLALAHGSAQILDEAGAWPIAATPIHQIHVSRRGAARVVGGNESLSSDLLPGFVLPLRELFG